MTVDRRHLFKQLGAAASLGALTALGCGEHHATAPTIAARPLAPPLRPPASGPVPVAVVLSEDAVVIDFAGPWEVFGDALAPDRDPAFMTFTVAETLQPIQVNGGMTILPTYTFDTAPPASVIVVPAQRSRRPALLAWLRARAQSADVTMAVCTGAFVLAHAGLLTGRAATTFHSAFDDLAGMAPGITVIRGARFVEDGPVATSGGLSAGIDLSLRVVERYYGRAAATETARVMEYQGRGWLDATSNADYAAEPQRPSTGPRCPVCGMHVVAPATAPSSSYQGTTYWFCSLADKRAFDAAPANFIHG